MNGRNDPHTATGVTPHQLSAIAQQLMIWHDQLKLAESVMQKTGNETIAVHAWKSSQKGMIIFKAFMDALEESRMRMAIGQPMAIGEHKPRFKSQNAAERTESIQKAVKKVKAARTKKP